MRWWVMVLSAALLFVLALSWPARAQELAHTASSDTLSGLVFDEVTGRPVAQASVTLTDFGDGRTVAEAASDEGGRFSVPVSPGRYWLVASRAGFAASPPREVRWDEASESVEGLLLRLRTLDREALAVRASPDPDVEGARLIGRVVDRDSGRPVFDAEVELGASGLRLRPRPLEETPVVPPAGQTCGRTPGRTRISGWPACCCSL